MSAAPEAMRKTKCLAVPTLFAGMMNMVNIFGIQSSSLSMNWQATSMGLGGILIVVSAGHVICSSPFAQGTHTRQKAFQQLACARCSGTAALVLTCFSILAWTQATLTTYDCAATQNCAAAQLPEGCQPSACEHYRTPGGWAQDSDCYSEWAHGRCSDGLNYYMSARPFGASSTACGQRTCCTTATTPPPAYQAGIEQPLLTCTREERQVGLNCFNNAACKFFAPIFAVVSGWSLICSMLFWWYLRSLVFALAAIRASYGDSIDPQRSVEMARFVARAETLRREDAQRPGVAMATPVSAEPIAGVPITAAQPVVVVTGVAVPGGAAEQQQGATTSATLTSATSREHGAAVGVAVQDQPVQGRAEA